MHALTPVLQPYDWGDAHTIPSMLGMPSSTAPVAEAWWGAHPVYPATIDGGEQGLDALIADDPMGALGPEIAEKHGHCLPYLLKILAIKKPLSLQVHPSREHAVAGYERENGLGIPVMDPQRTFRDDNHKPEMVVALTPTVVLTGFRPVEELRADLALLDADGARVLEGVLDDADDDEDAISEYVDACLRGIQPMPVLVSLKAAVAAGRGSDAMHTAADALDAHPGDPGVLVALAMNVVRLEPGEASFTGDGIVHSYQSGVALEIMANSDNVVRAGLTPKHIDLGQLLFLAQTRPTAPQVPTIEVDGPVTKFTTAADEFALALLRRGAFASQPGPRIVLALEGTTTVVAGGRVAILAAGESVFIGYSEGPAAVETAGLAAIATIPRG